MLLKVKKLSDRNSREIAAIYITSHLSVSTICQYCGKEISFGKISPPLADGLIVSGDVSDPSAAHEMPTCNQFDKMSIVDFAIEARSFRKPDKKELN